MFRWLLRVPSTKLCRPWRPPRPHCEGIPHGRKLSWMGRGFWAFKMEGFDGWNGHQWGLPNVSSVQDWDNGPEGAPKPQKVS